MSYIANVARAKPGGTGKAPGVTKPPSAVAISDALLELGGELGSPSECAAALAIALGHLVSVGLADGDKMIALASELGRPVRRIVH